MFSQMCRLCSGPVRRGALCALVLAGTAVLAFAQTSSFGQAAQGIATEMIAIAKWVGIILCIICGIGLKEPTDGAKIQQLRPAATVNIR